MSLRKGTTSRDCPDGFHSVIAYKLYELLDSFHKRWENYSFIKPVSGPAPSDKHWLWTQFTCFRARQVDAWNPWLVKNNKLILASLVKSVIIAFSKLSINHIHDSTGKWESGKCGQPIIVWGYDEDMISCHMIICLCMDWTHLSGSSLLTVGWCWGIQ